MKNVTDGKKQILENEPSVQAVRPFSQIKIRDEDENIRREIDGLNKNSLIIRKEMQALSSIRVNLLWMLRKATLHAQKSRKKSNSSCKMPNVTGQQRTVVT